MKHLIGYLGLLAKEEDIGFQLDDERAQDLVDLAYEVQLLPIIVWAERF